MKSKGCNSQSPVLDTTDSCPAALDETTRILAENHRMLLEISRKLDAIMEHLKVPYKPPAGFLKE